MNVDIIVMLVTVLGLFMGGLTFYVNRQDKSIDSAHLRIDEMSDTVVRDIVFDRLREDIKNMENKIISRLDHIERGSNAK